jgi:hypothetical protein
MQYTVGKTTPSPYFLVRLGDGTKERTISILSKKQPEMAVFC